MGTELHWVDGPWTGKLALSARPRGGDWLGDEMAAWRRAGIDTVFSLLTPEEEQDLDLKQEAHEANAHEMSSYRCEFPIARCQIPSPSYLLCWTGSRVTCQRERMW